MSSWPALRPRALLLVVVPIALLGAAKLGDEFLRLVWRSGRFAAIDLGLRHVEVQAWFAGVPVYQAMPVTAAYPPASYAMLWPFLGWLAFEPARWLWAVTTLAALVWTTRLLVRESGASSRIERASAALLLLAVNQTGVAVGNGQLILHVLPPLLAGLLLLERRVPSMGRDVVAAACMVFALIKITITVPFLWLMLFASAPDEGRHPHASAVRLRAAALVAVGYTVCTLLAASFQPGNLAQLLRAWLTVAGGAPGTGGYGSVHSWLLALDLDALLLPATGALFLAAGFWAWRYRRVDIWIRLGIIALISRFWTYHRLYDDVIVVLALVALYRLARAKDGRPWGVVLGVTFAFMLLPARLHLAPAPWHLVFNGAHAITWAVALGALLWRAERGRGPGAPGLTLASSPGLS